VARAAQAGQQDGSGRGQDRAAEQGEPADDVPSSIMMIPASSATGTAATSTSAITATAMTALPDMFRRRAAYQPAISSPFKNLDA
jgi:hypothetical protein